MGLLSNKNDLRRYLGPKRIVLLVGFALFSAVAWYLWRQGFLSPQLLFSYIESNPVLAPVVFVFLYSVCVIFLVPSLPFNLAAGFLWGPIVGSLFALAGSVLGSICTFFFMRTALGQPLAKRYDNALVTWMQLQVEQRGWEVVALMSVSPLPTGVRNVVLGLTSISSFTFMWASTAFLYPPVLAVSYLGMASGQLVLEGDYKRAFELLIMSLAAVAALIVFRMVIKWFFGKDADEPPVDKK